MSKSNGKRQFISNLFFAFLAQGISFLLSLLMSLIVPKLLSVESYGYWQLFIFYSSYVGLFHFGFNDGVYLINGGKDYEQLEKNKIGSAMYISIFLQIVLSAIIWLIANANVESYERKLVLIFTIIYMLIFNTSLCIGYVFQSINQTKKYSISDMIDKISFICALCVLLMLKVKNFKYYILFYIISKGISLIYCIINAKEIVFVEKFSFFVALKEYINYSKVGINLTIAGLASMFIMGIGRIVIDDVWGIEEFGRFSLVLSLASFALVFIRQISMVLFPTLSRMDFKEQICLYADIRGLIFSIMPIIFVFYVPVKVLMQLWLPQYKESLEYLFVVMPVCFFDAKMNLLCSTYFKALRLEKYLKRINILTLCISITLCVISGYVIHNSVMVLISMVISVAFRSIKSEYYLAKVIKYDISKTMVGEICFVVVFVFITMTCTDIISFIVIVLVYVIFYVINKATFSTAKKNIVNFIK